ncbi:MAG TPA: hypothetical protein VLF18_21375 [Tahibacter sp.]|uniref:hypothetical protein n=1 Tax=Tahibacter sp. TaxID=2056211 RepID=UPI002CA2BA9A|nr:hypothetical protein [Tahibacter sp.]HSX62742.1 hypothetical protein [Tahibacter sp.]
MPRLRSDWTLTIVLLAAGGALAQAMWPVQVAPVLRLTIERNAEPIAHLDQPRKIIETREVVVDRLDLSRDGRLRHAELGDIGYAEQFFVTLRKRFAVLGDGDYRFLVGSDDGFSLRIDNRPVCADPRPHAMALQPCDIRLAHGEHEFALDYFQGSGPSGLSVQYRRRDRSRSYWFGEDSDLFGFAREAR